MKIARMTAAHAILFVLRGVPALYYHSLLGSENDLKGMETSGINRRINREKLPLVALETELTTPGTLRYGVFSSLNKLLQLRQKHPAFSPLAAQKTLLLDDAFFGVERCSPDGNDTLTCVVNVSAGRQTLRLNVSGTCLLSGETFTGVCWQVLWIQHSGD